MLLGYRVLCECVMDVKLFTSLGYLYQSQSNIKILEINISFPDNSNIYSNSGPHQGTSDERNTGV